MPRNPPGPEPDPSAVPIRTCIGCRRRRAQLDLTRVVRTAAGTLVVGRTAPGRGAWLCGAECARLAARRRAFARALRAPVDETAVRELLELFEEQQENVRD